MLPIKDKYQNKYYTIGDKLYVDILALNKTRHIGNLSYNTKDKYYNLIIFRTGDMKLPFGYMISAFPLEAMPINRLILEVDKVEYYMMLWTPEIKKQCFKLTPHDGNEEFFLISDPFWTRLDISTISVVS